MQNRELTTWHRSTRCCFTECVCVHWAHEAPYVQSLQHQALQLTPFNTSKNAKQRAHNLTPRQEKPLTSKHDIRAPSPWTEAWDAVSLNVFVFTEYKHPPENGQALRQIPAMSQAQPYPWPGIQHNMKHWRANPRCLPLFQTRHRSNADFTFGRPAEQTALPPYNRGGPKKTRPGARNFKSSLEFALFGP